MTIDGVATLISHRGPTTLPGAPPDTSQGETVVCIHDAGSSGRWFAPLLDALAADHSPLTYDQPGHGRSGSLDALGSIDAMVDHLAALLDALAISQPVLIGDGLGSVIAVEAARRPSLARAVVLCGAVAERDELGAEIDDLAAVTAGKARRNFDRSGYAPTTERPVFEQAFAAWVPTDPRATLGARRAQAAWSLDDGPTVPALIVVGEHTEPEHTAAAEALAGRLPSATVEHLADAGRRSTIERPTELAARVSRFVADLGAGAGVGGDAQGEGRGS